MLDIGALIWYDTGEMKGWSPMKKVLINTAIALAIMLSASVARADHETTDNMFTFHAFCNMLSQSASMGDNYESCVANQTELFARFDDTIEYLAARDQHRTSMEKFYEALPIEKLTGEGVLNIMYSTRTEI